MSSIPGDEAPRLSFGYTPALEIWLLDYKEERARYLNEHGLTRITSYNVCYTKLLRVYNKCITVV